VTLTKKKWRGELPTNSQLDRTKVLPSTTLSFCLAALVDPVERDKCKLTVEHGVRCRLDSPRGSEAKAVFNAPSRLLSPARRNALNCHSANSQSHLQHVDLPPTTNGVQPTA